MRTLCWVNSNIFRFKNLPDEIILKCIPIVNAGLFTDDVEIQSDCLWTMSYMADTQNDRIIEQIATS